jgi:hypothetical protein
MSDRHNLESVARGPGNLFGIAVMTVPSEIIPLDVNLHIAEPSR